jgi:hypothetical protein
MAANLGNLTQIPTLEFKRETKHKSSEGKKSTCKPTSKLEAKLGDQAIQLRFSSEALDEGEDYSTQRAIIQGGSGKQPACE